MRLFSTSGADAAYDRWLDPPEVHEVDECMDCHEAGEHNPIEYYEVCDGCAKDLADRAQHTTIEFKFTVADVEKARDWARANKYRLGHDYYTVEDLLYQAMRERVIQTDHWETI